MVNINCCHHCKRRAVGCHGSCSEYQALRAARDAELNADIERKEQVYQLWKQRRRANNRERDRLWRERKKAEREGRQ